MFREAAKRERELKVAREQLENEQRKTKKLETQMVELSKKLESEQKVSFKQNVQLAEMGRKDTTIKNLKMKCLKTDYNSKKSLLRQKRDDNEQLIEHLAKTLGSNSNDASKEAVKAAIEKLNSYSASLFFSLDQLQQGYEERKRELETSPSSTQTEVNIDLSSVSSPDLASIELDTLRLLTTANYNNSRPTPAQTPFSQPPPTTRPPPPVSPAALSRPPPSVSPGTLSRPPPSVSQSTRAPPPGLAGNPNRSSPLPTPGPAKGERPGPSRIQGSSSSSSAARGAAGGAGAL